MTRQDLFKRLAQAGLRARDYLAVAIASGVALVTRHEDFSLAFTATILFYLPALKHASVDAGLLYTGDVLGFYWPSLIKAHSLLSSFHFTAIDFSSFNGSADFFVTPNLSAVYPLVVIYAADRAILNVDARYWPMARHHAGY
jgi:hypothetical protein